MNQSYLSVIALASHYLTIKIKQVTPLCKPLIESWIMISGFFTTSAILDRVWKKMDW